MSLYKPGIVKRENNYDLLRIIAAIAVIVLHVSGSYYTAVVSDGWFGVCYTDNVFVTCVFNRLSRFAVPCFIMISGAFALDNSENTNFKYYYRKIFKSLGIPTIIFSILYFIYKEILIIISLLRNGGGYQEILVPVKSWIKGEPYPHMWYLYMMAGIFLFVPVIIRVKLKMGENIFTKFVLVTCILSLISNMTSVHKFYWDFGFSFCYLGYFLLGYTIREHLKCNKNNIKAIFLIVLSFLILLVDVWIYYIQIMRKYESVNLKYLSVIIVAFASVVMFCGFTILDIKFTFSWLPGIAFEIYLIHAGVWNILQHIISVDMDSRIVILLCTMIVLSVSITGGFIYNKLWKWIDNKWILSDKLCYLIKL